MKAAIYARYSSDKQRESSIEDQTRNCRRYAEREGWGVGTAYADRAISGAKADRPEYQKMLADAQAKKFDVLLIDDLSRLTRDEAEAILVIRRIRHWGIRIIAVSDGFDSAAKGYKIQAGMRGMINEIYLDDLREKTHRGMAGRALQGLNTGGRAYGYRHIPIEDPSHLDQFSRPTITAVRREVDPDQAAAIREVFALFADGYGYGAVARALNARGVKSPRGKTWAGSAIRPMLANEIYTGRLVWNRTEWVRDPDTQKVAPRPRPQDEWIVTDQPHLRIIGQELWERVQARRAEMLEQHRVHQKVRGPNTRPGKIPTHLLSGIVKCAQCGGNYIVANRTHYRCSTHINRGEVACTNAVSVRRDVLEQRLLRAIKEELFDGASFEQFKAEARRVLDERIKSRNRDGATLRRDLAQTEREIQRMIEFIKAGTITPTLSQELRKAEGEARRLREALDADLPQIENVEEILNDALDRYWSLVLNLETVAARDVSKARTVIKGLVGGSIKLVPTKVGGLNAELQGDYAGLIELVASTTKGPGARKIGMVAGARTPRQLRLPPVLV